MRDKLPPQDTLSLKWDNIYKGAATMKLDLSVSVPSIPEADKQETSLVSGTRELPDHPPKEWAERMRAKYGLMPLSANAREVLGRGHRKMGPAGGGVTAGVGGVLRAARRRLDGVDLRSGQEHRAHPQERRGHRFLLLAAAPQARRRQVHQGHRVGAHFLHDRVRRGDRDDQAGGNPAGGEHGGPP